ncbi:MAG: ABC transporter ATP-binding protein [Candidatus Thermoplasmatota archaeon]|nr:ABC transporter ATP-binding protein [Candidatus Thermoplasmatota archaeon]
MVEPAIELKDVSVSLGNKIVLKDVTVSLDEGTFLGIIGPNGGGKTTLLKVLLGLLTPEQGDVRIHGKTPSKVSDVIGYVPQYSNFDAQFPISVWDVVLMGRVGELGWKPFYSKEDKKIAEASLKMVDMLEYKDRQISELSGGQQQRVLIARALTIEPKILLLDEPTASIDEKIQTNIYELLQKLNKKKNITIILVSHDIGVISSYVDEVACLNQYLIYHGSDELTSEMIEASYECPVDLVAHGHPHRVFEHKMPSEEED